MQRMQSCAAIALGSECYRISSGIALKSENGSPETCACEPNIKESDESDDDNTSNACAIPAEDLEERYQLIRASAPLHMLRIAGAEGAAADTHRSFSFQVLNFDLAGVSKAQRKLVFRCTSGSMQPWEESIVTVVPTQPTASPVCCRYIVLVQDSFTLMPHMFHVNDCSSATVAQCMMQVYSAYGCPTRPRVIIDSPPQFRSRLAQELHEITKAQCAHAKFPRVVPCHQQTRIHVVRMRGRRPHKALSCFIPRVDVRTINEFAAKEQEYESRIKAANEEFANKEKQLTTELASTKKAIDKVSAELASSKGELDKANATCKQLSDEVKELKGQLVQSQKKHETAVKDANALSQELERVKGEYSRSAPTSRAAPAALDTVPKSEDAPTDDDDEFIRLLRADPVLYHDCRVFAALLYFGHFCLPPIRKIFEDLHAEIKRNPDTSWKDEIQKRLKSPSDEHQYDTEKLNGDSGPFELLKACLPHQHLRKYNGFDDLDLSASMTLLLAFKACKVVPENIRKCAETIRTERNNNCHISLHQQHQFNPNAIKVLRDNINEISLHLLRISQLQATKSLDTVKTLLSLTVCHDSPQGSHGACPPRERARSNSSSSNNAAPSPSDPSKRVHVKWKSRVRDKAVTDAELRQAFSQFGDVEKADPVHNHKVNWYFCFVQFQTVDSARQAVDAKQIQIGSVVANIENPKNTGAGRR